jgi:general secretion pathway protein I
MKFVSIGTPAASPSAPRQLNNREAGFTLLEALAALTLILAFAAAVVPLLFHSRRIMLNAGGRVAAQILARSLLQEPLDRTSLANLAQNGETEGLEWQLRSEPADVVTSLPSRGSGQKPAAQTGAAAAPAVRWAAYRVIASVSWAPGQSVRAETVRLGKAE